MWVFHDDAVDSRGVGIGVGGADDGMEMRKRRLERWDECDWSSSKGRGCCGLDGFYILL
jgi:hypothetical protein